jgi:predicted DNA-binding transcriptional regulator AlpA
VDPYIILKKLTPKQRQAFILRHVHNLTLRRISLRMGGSRASICNLLRRADQRLGIGITLPPRIRVRRRRVRWISLSQVYNY